MDAIKPQFPVIQLNEVLLKENTQWLHFAEPQRIIQVDELKGVIPALREIEDLIQAYDWYAAGFLSYEAAPAFDPAHQTQPGTGFPYLWFGLYPAPGLVILPEAARPKASLAWLPTVDRDTYNASIEQIRNYIADGRTYQVNYTMRLHADFRVDPWNFFLHLAQTQNNHAAYIDTGRYVICSASPELFFQLEGETITCRPMKGTAYRGRTTLEDAEQAQWLKDSEKNRAENVMIVDMIRNDLGRIAKIGTVHVPELFTVERYPTLWQMTSTVSATSAASIKDIFAALFPCASITGAPKVSTMRIISELETTPRNIYTGSIGYIAPGRKAKFNVAIRTAVVDRTAQTAEYGIGGGIVWDSTSTDEYAEALLKARVLTETSPEFSLLETLLWTPGEGFFLLEKHIGRLLDSARYFGFSVSSQLRWSSSPERSSRGVSRPQHSKDSPNTYQWSRYVALTSGATTRPPLETEIIEDYLNDLSSQFTSPQRVRLLLDKNGQLRSEAKPFQPTGENDLWKVCLAKEPVSSNDIFLFHKTTHRDIYEAARKDFPEYADVLLYNEHGELTEFTTGNLVVELNGQLFTPPITCGLLAGTFRAHLLDTGQAEERTIRVEELNNCTKIYLVNSVRKWQKVILKYEGLSSA